VTNYNTMPTIQLNLISTIKNLRNKEFMQLYLQLMELTEQYAATTKNEYIQRIYKDMQKEVERVKQLDVKLNVALETVKERNELHIEIKNLIRHIKLMLGSDLLSPLNDNREKAAYISGRLDGLVDLKNVTSTAATIKTIERIRQTIENDTTLTNALMELELMSSVVILYKQGEEFKQLEEQKHIDKLTAPNINKTAIRKEAANTLSLLFKAIQVNHACKERCTRQISI